MQENFSRFKSRYIFLDFILLAIIFGILIGIASAASGFDPEILFKDTILLHLVNVLLMTGFCFSILYRLKRSNLKLKHLIGNTSFRDQSWLMLFIIFYGILTLEHGISQLTIFFAHLVSPDFAKSATESAAIPFAYETDSLALRIIFYVLTVISVVIVAPVAEEFIFRGVILHRFAAKWGVTSAILLSSCLFGIAHMNIHAISIGVSFIFVALVYIQTQSLIVPIAFHAINNLIATISGLVSILSSSDHQTQITFLTLWDGLFNTAFALPILFYFLKWQSHSDLLPYNANVENQK